MKLLEGKVAIVTGAARDTVRLRFKVCAEGANIAFIRPGYRRER